MLDLKDSKRERVLLAGLIHDDIHVSDMESILDELALLALTAGLEVTGSMTQTRRKVNPSTFIGSGKVQEMKELAEKESIHTVIFDEDLSPAQAKNIQEATGLKVIDRTGLILDIFAQRARSKEAKIQVELAQLKYLLPRLTRMWIHLSRQEGGIGIRGPGETQLEVDRRRIRNRIQHLSRDLVKIERQRTESRKSRHDVYRVTLVGYTNAGKSTLLNTIAHTNVPTENLLFKTLDSITRLVFYPGGLKVLFTDTVGFIEKLPPHLIASFKSSLDEVREADLLLHVVDISHPRWERQIEVVRSVLEEMGVLDTPCIPVFNKVDALPYDGLLDSVHSRFPDSTSISALTGEGVESLRQCVAQEATKTSTVLTLQIDSDDSESIRKLFRHGTVLNSSGENGTMVVTVRMDRIQAIKCGFLEDTR